MTWIVNWKGADFDVDPTEFDGLELSEIKKRTGFSFKDLVEGIGQLDPEAFRAIFWTVERRTDPELKFSEYAGPNMRVILPSLEGFDQALDEVMGGLGKAKTPGSSGSQPSPSSTDAPTGESGND